MHVKYRNVNEAFRGLVTEFYEAGRRSPNIVRSTSRNGDVLYIQEPVTITYTHPRERVLFNQARDCNPFFHVYEALWMLAGRNDVAPLKYYVSTIDQFSDDGDIFNGAYGWRWRGSRYRQDGNLYWDQDQLKLIIEHLKAKPDSRRAVLQIWNVEDDLLKIGNLPYYGSAKDSDPGSKDVCCNLVVTFLIREQKFPDFGSTPGLVKQYLDMTVFNRSNDMIWGMLGANVVHFSMLQEYMAACIDVEVGMYHQITNNLHAYQNDKWQPEKWLLWYSNTSGFDGKLSADGDYSSAIKTFPLVKDPATFDRECAEFVERHQRDALAGLYVEPFLRDVAQPMCVAFHHHKKRDYTSALLVARDLIKADDWRIAATNWLLKRKANYESRRTEVH